MYLASATRWMKYIESIDEKNTSVMLVGHNPGLTELVNICGYSLDNLPTCGVVVFRYEGAHRGNFEPKKCVFHASYFPKNNLS
jgi:phosphohistidine phosphatase